MIHNDPNQQRLLAHVRPETWTQPAPTGRYNLVVIGAGTAGLVTAAGAAGLGAKVAIVERHRMGGDCLNFGCVPSKALLASARDIASARRAAEYGVQTSGEPDFGAVMTRMRRLRAGLAHHDSADRFAGLGVDVFFGEAKFSGPDTVVVGNQHLTFARAAIATGARSAVPPIAGLADVRFYTNESIFDLTTRPDSLVVIGAGPIGCELAQAFRRFGSRVTVLDRGGALPREDADAAALVEQALRRDGVDLRLGATLVRVEAGERGAAVVFEHAGVDQSVDADALLVATGRIANVEGLNLSAAGVRVDERGVVVDDWLRTTNRRIYAAGDCCTAFKFTHAADAMARIVIQNALFFGRRRVSDLTIPWATYTDPEVAHVGLAESEARTRGAEVVTLTQPMSGVDRAVLEERTDGFARVHVEAKSGLVLGATVVAPHAGDLIGEMAIVMASKMTIGTVGATIHPYPTHSEAWKKLGDQWNRRRLTPLVARLFASLMKWRRR